MIRPTLIVAVSDPDTVIPRLVPYVMLAETRLGGGISFTSVFGERKEPGFWYACGSISATRGV